MSTIHAHVEIVSRDCDGTYERTYVSLSDEGQTLAEYRDTLVDLYSSEDGVVLTDTVGRFEYGETTEEGHRYTDILFCQSADCLDEPGTFRDRTAEAAGY